MYTTGLNMTRVRHVCSTHTRYFEFYDRHDVGFILHYMAWSAIYTCVSGATAHDLGSSWRARY